MQEKLVSIIIPAYNAGKYIGQCINSILNQSYKNIEIIVVYDRSSDDTLDVINNFKEKLTVIIQEKSSPSIARNRGINESKGEYIAFCDSDDYFNMEKIERQVEFLDKNPDVGLTYTDFTIVNPEGHVIRQIFCPEWNAHKWIFRQYIALSSIMVRRTLLLRLLDNDGHYFDEVYPAFEDYDFLMRLSNGSKFSRVPSFLLNYRNSPLSLGKRYQWMVSLRLTILKKNNHYVALVYFAFFDTPLTFLRLSIRKLR